MTLVEAVRALRERGISERRIAEALGTSQATINRLKRGKTIGCSYELGDRLISYATSVSNGLLSNEQMEAPATTLASSDQGGTLIRNTNSQPLRCELLFRDGTKAIVVMPPGLGMLFTTGPGLMTISLVNNSSPVDSYPLDAHSSQVV